MSTPSMVGMRDGCSIGIERVAPPCGGSTSRWTIAWAQNFECLAAWELASKSITDDTADRSARAKLASLSSATPPERSPRRPSPGRDEKCGSPGFPSSARLTWDKPTSSRVPRPLARAHNSSRARMPSVLSTPVRPAYLPQDSQESELGHHVGIRARLSRDDRPSLSSVCHPIPHDARLECTGMPASAAQRCEAKRKGAGWTSGKGSSSASAPTTTHSHG